MSDAFSEGEKKRTVRNEIMAASSMLQLQLIMPWEFGSFLPKITLLN